MANDYIEIKGFSNRNFEIKGFEELNRKLKKLDDKITRREVLKVQRKIAIPISKAYAQALPVGTRDKKRVGSVYVAGTLSKSVGPKTVPASKVGGNPSVVVRPRKTGKYDPWYRFMVVRKGTKIGSASRGSREGINTVVEDARNKAWSVLSPSTVKKYQEQAVRLIQRQIDKLSN